ncbi:MAG: acyl-CoA carboxylase subunit beta [Thermoleophilaceae bacterium]
MTQTVQQLPSARRRLDPLERLELLCDPGSLRVLRSHVASVRLGAKARPGDGVIGGSGRVEGRPVYCYAQDSSFAGGSLGAAHADTITEVLRLAGRARAPVVGFVDSGGARLQEGVAALDGYGRVFREIVALSAVVPQISVICGAAAGGAAYSPALTDFVVMDREAAMFLTGPAVVREAIGEDVTAAELGGASVHERSGVCELVAESEADAVHAARELLSYLPQSAYDEPPRRPVAVPEEGGDPGALVPRSPRRVYDVRLVIDELADSGSALEVAPRFARNMVTSLARIEGRPVGFIANQPRHLGGTIDWAAARKAARFVRICDAYGLPLVVLVDAPGFLPGSAQERAGVQREGAKLLHAFAEATVPKLTVVLRKAFGGAYITMNSKALGADLAAAWPDAEIGVMGGQQAASVINRREIAAAADEASERASRGAAYAAEHLGAAVAAREGAIDAVIEPADTRSWIAWGLGSFGGRSGGRRARSGNFPL